MTRYIYAFNEGRSEDRALLGGKGADLAEMASLGLPVPPGFTITTEACRHYLRHGELPPSLSHELRRHMVQLERESGRFFGDAGDPLLVSVRSGAATSMPGMMDTVLDIGLNDRTVLGLARRTGDQRMAVDCYRRLIQMFGETVLGVPDARYADALEAVKAEEDASTDVELSADALRRVVARYLEITESWTGAPFPQDPADQLDRAIRAVFDSWRGERAGLYRCQHGIADDLGTAVNVQAMVFGNRGPRSGSGVAFTRDPATGDLGPYGEYLPTAQGEDVVSGTRDAVPLAELRTIDARAFVRLRSIMGTLERRYRDMCDIEFTIEDGHLWILQTRIGKRTAAAAFRIAVDCVDAGTIDLDEALLRVTGEQLAQLLHPTFDPVAERSLLARGLGASPGAVVGRVVFDSQTATEYADRGETVILARPETRPDDLPGMIAAAGIVTSRGGKTSHAAVVARGMGRACVCGADALQIDVAGRRMRTAGGTEVREGDLISLDGDTGDVFRGEVPVVPSAVARWFTSGEVPDDQAAADLVAAVARLVGHADEVRLLGVRANADDADAAARAFRLGAEGIGLCRTEHMFLGKRRALVERLILADGEDARARTLRELLDLQRQDFAELFAAAEGRPVTIRLLDPPLHEFLPDPVDLAVRVAVAQERGEPDAETERLWETVRTMRETNPMLGLRGVRLAVAVPGLAAMQTRAILEAAHAHVDLGGTADVEIMVPLVASAAELAFVRAQIDEVAAEIDLTSGRTVHHRVGAMLELPRAAMTAAALGEHADFFSFGTNDLTQTTWGLSRDDAEVSVVRRYLDLGILKRSPFETIDIEGVGALVRAAVDAVRAGGRGIRLGVCGEHAGDPDSIAFFDEIGLDYVSCSPYRIPVARLEAGRSALRARRAGARPVERQVLVASDGATG